MSERPCDTCQHKGGGKRNGKTRGLCTARQIPTPMMGGLKAQMLEALWYARTQAGICGPEGRLWKARTTPTASRRVSASTPSPHKGEPR